MCQANRSERSFSGQDRWCDYFGQRHFLLLVSCFLGCVGRLMLRNRTIQKRGTCLKVPKHKGIQEYFRVAEKSGISDLRHYYVLKRSKFIKQYARKPYFCKKISNDYHRTFGIQKVTQVPEKIFFCYKTEP